MGYALNARDAQDQPPGRTDLWDASQAKRSKSGTEKKNAEPASYVEAP